MQTAIHETLPDDWREYFKEGDVALELSDEYARELYGYSHARKHGEADEPPYDFGAGLTPMQTGRVAYRLYQRVNGPYLNGLSSIESSLRNAIQLQTMRGGSSATGATIVSTARDGFVESGWPRSVVDAALIEAALHC